MPGRLPTKGDFAPAIVLSVTPPPGTKPPVNVLILLHGAGDTNISFNNLGRQLSLPETACISLQAPTPLPFDLGGFHWGDDIVFDPNTGAVDFDTGFKKSSLLMQQKVVKVLIDKCGFQAREIMFFGFGQGGMAALATILLEYPVQEDHEEVSTSSKTGSSTNRSLPEYAGAISIGGPLPAGALDTTTSVKNRTPILVVGGSSNSLVTDEALRRLLAAFVFVNSSRYRRQGDTMPRDRDEMMPIMHFFSRRLRSRAGVPEGSVEIG
jgi:hypothetical protein